MSELKEFSASEIPEWVCDSLFELDQISPREYRREGESKSVNPIDRMNAICKHLFELMPKSKSISQYFDQPAFLKFDDLSETKLSINPFLHTDRTEITREELGL